MKIGVLTLVALATSTAYGLSPASKAVIVSYSDNAPDSVLDQAKDAIKAGGGIITHEYKLFKGFAAKAPVKVLDMVQAWGNDYQAYIEEEQIISVS